MNVQKIYFPNLNGLRFIAAVLVIIHHIEQLKSLKQMESYWRVVPFIEVIGKLGVVLFFVLSGFLITYLLLAEERSFKKISIKQFYIRRVLRIWPLYFLIVILAFLILPNIGLFNIPGYDKAHIYFNLGPKLILYALIFPNLALPLLGIVPYVSHTWSIGTEEQFYLLWPILLSCFKKYRSALMVAVVVFYLGIKYLLLPASADLIPHHNAITLFWYALPIDCMAIGGLYAVLFFQKNQILKHLLRNDLFYFSLALVSILMAKGVHIPYVHYEFYSVFFGIIILNFAANEKIGLSLENKAFNYLGKISYGLYMYHPIAIVLAISICLSINFSSNWLLYPLSLILAIILAGLSYRYFESFFLKLKNRFSVIVSGNEN